MEKDTLETIAQRLDRLEKMMTEVNQKLSGIVEQMVPDVPKDRKTAAAPRDCKTGEEVMAYYGRNKKQNTEIIRKMFEKMGISGEPIPAEELQARMAQHGIRAEDNEFSRAIIEEREK